MEANHLSGVSVASLVGFTSSGMFYNWLQDRVLDTTKAKYDAAAKAFLDGTSAEESAQPRARPAIAQRLVRHMAVVGLSQAALASLVGFDCPSDLGRWLQGDDSLRGYDDAVRAYLAARTGDMLVDADTFEQMAALDAPGPLHIHPFLFGPRGDGEGSAKTGLRTFGASHWLGREVVIEPSELPWSANFETILEFLRLATADNASVVEDGDTFGAEDGSTVTRVTHREAGEGAEGETSAYVLTPLKHDGHGFAAEEDELEVGLETEDAVVEMAAEAEAAEVEAAADEPEVEIPVDEVERPDPVAEADNVTPMPSQPGEASISGTSLRAKLFSNRGA